MVNLLSMHCYRLNKYWLNQYKPGKFKLFHDYIHISAYEIYFHLITISVNLQIKTTYDHSADKDLHF